MFIRNLSKKHIHIISFDIPLPANYGGVIDVYYKIKAFHDIGINVHLHCYEYGLRSKNADLEKVCASVNYYKRNVSKTNLFRRRPYIVVTRNSDELINNLVKDNYPILFEGLHSCYFLNDKRLKKRKKIVRTHNIEHDYYYNLAKVEKDLFKKYYFYNEASKLRRYESILENANGIACISKNDYLHFSKNYKNVQVVSAFHPNNKVEIKEGKGEYALYHGALGVGENNEAALFLINQVFNNINIPLIIAGNKPSNELKNNVSKYSNIKLISDISTEEIYNLVENAHINILPTFQATGIKLKLLASLFKGRYCLVNTPMVENTGLEELCIIKDEAKDIKEEVLSLFKKSFEQSEILHRENILINKGFVNDTNIYKLQKMLF